MTRTQALPRDPRSSAMLRKYPFGVFCGGHLLRQRPQISGGTMKQLGFLMLVVSLAGTSMACDDDNDASPSSLPLVFSAVLSPANEVPAIANAEGSGRGAVQATFTTTRDGSGAITAATVNFHVQLYDFPAGTRLQAAHIHNGGAGVNGPVRVDTGFTPAIARELTDGSTVIDIGGIAVDPVIMQGIIDNPAAWYFNVHSPVNPGGFARGQLARVQ
jgi:hypothetical protein